MIIGSVCSGIGAPECAWHPLGWRSAFMSEIDAFPRAVLAHHYPEVPLHGDFTTIQASNYGAIDLLVGGTPCQSFSVAGLRGGMADERGNLALEYLRLADRLRPRWLVWENVPGVLSSAGGRDFGAFVGGLADLGYGWAYRCLDAQHFGLAQRRLRVFVVAHLGDWRTAAAVLFEPASLRGDSAPGREAGERVAPTVARGSPGGRTHSLDADTADSLIAATSSGHGWWDEAEVGATLRAQDSITKADTLIARCLTGHPSRSDWETETFIAHTLRAEGHDASEGGTGRGVPLVAASLTSGTGNGARPSGRLQEDDTNLVAFGWQNSASQGDSVSDTTAPTLDKSKHSAVAFAQNQGAAVRRLTPRECERLQGFPDDYTLIPYRRGMAKDGPRYRALGNSMAVPVMRWIGRRISVVDMSLTALERPA